MSSFARLRALAIRVPKLVGSKTVIALLLTETVFGRKQTDRNKEAERAHTGSQYRSMLYDVLLCPFFCVFDSSQPFLCHDLEYLLQSLPAVFNLITILAQLLLQLGRIQDAIRARSLQGTEHVLEPERLPLQVRSDVLFGQFHDLDIADLAGCHLFGLSATQLRTWNPGLNEASEWLQAHIDLQGYRCPSPHSQLG